jgi:hypothetical protein
MVIHQIFFLSFFPLLYVKTVWLNSARNMPLQGNNNENYLLCYVLRYVNLFTEVRFLCEPKQINVDTLASIITDSY